MLIAIPWQSDLLVHSDLLMKLQQIETCMGRPPLLYGAHQAVSHDVFESIKNANLPAIGGGSNGPGVEQIAATAKAALADDFATVNANINKPRTLQ